MVVTAKRVKFTNIYCSLPDSSANSSMDAAKCLLDSMELPTLQSSLKSLCIIFWYSTEISNTYFEFSIAPLMLLGFRSVEPYG